MAHGSRHGASGVDPIAVTSLSGFPGGTSQFLRSDGAFAAPPGGGAANWGDITGTLSNQTDLDTALDGKEPANANIQAHIASAHAPADAQKNSDITKAEIEAKLTGEITSHTHPAGGSDPFVAKLRLAADVSTAADTNPVTLTGLTFSFLANSTYVLDFFGITQAPAATTGSGFHLDVSVAVTTIALSFTHQLANAGTLTGGSSIADDASVGLSSGRPTANVNTPVLGGGVLITGASPGTATLRMRSEVAAVSTCKAGSVLRVMKV